MFSFLQIERPKSFLFKKKTIKSHASKANSELKRATNEADWLNFAKRCLAAHIPEDEPCTHDQVFVKQKQVRCHDEIETSFVSCKLCGKVERR